MARNITLITGVGNTPTGKTLLAKNMALVFKNPVFLDGYLYGKKSTFYWQSITEDTDVVIIDDVPKKLLMSLIKEVSKSIKIDRKGKYPITLKLPRVLITCSFEDAKDIQSLVDLGYEVILTSIETPFKKPLFQTHKL